MPASHGNHSPSLIPASSPDVAYPPNRLDDTMADEIDRDRSMFRDGSCLHQSIEEDLSRVVSHLQLCSMKLSGNLATANPVKTSLRSVGNPRSTTASCTFSIDGENREPSTGVWVCRISPALFSLNCCLDELAIGSAVYVRSSDYKLLGYNQIAKAMLGFDESMLDKRICSVPSGSDRRLDETSEELMREGVNRLSFEHESEAFDGRWYRWVTLKWRLAQADNTDFYLLSLTKPLRRIESVRKIPGPLLGEQLLLYQRLDDTDQKICNGISLGDSTSEIACAVGLTRRSVEVRRAKILEHFGFTRKVQIVRMMVRLEEHSLLSS